MRGAPRFHRWMAAVATGALAGVGLVAAPPAQADTRPADVSLPVTVSADALPTVQINGVVWSQLIVGGTVYVGGNFTSARPAGSPAGTDEVARTHLLAYDLATGVLVPGFAPVLNGQVKDLAVSPDQSTLYVGGQFTAVNGQNRYRAAAFDVATGVLTGFRPTVNATVAAISVTNDAVYLGGTFTTVNKETRTNVVAVTRSTGLTNLPFAVTIADGAVNAMALAPDGGSVVIGGSFTSVNGSSSPGYGLARLEATTGASLPLPVNAVARNAGLDAAILSLESDGVNFYGTGFHFGGAGNVEGTFAADWATGNLVWIEDCHGDTYSAYPVGGAVYTASHKHYCGNSDGFPQTTPWTYHRATAFSTAPRGINTPDIYGYPDHDGEPAPAPLNWYPDVNAGTFTGKDQGPWTVSGNAQFVIMGGEFTRVSGKAQQGLVRFAIPQNAPNQEGPALTGSEYPLVAASAKSGEVRLTWRTNHDPDNETLNYRIYRDTQLSAPVYEGAVTTPFWKPRAMTFLDTGLAPGSSPRYRLVVTDTFGNMAQSDWVTVSVSTATAPAPYRQKVLDEAPAAYWRLNESSGTTILDTTGFVGATAASGVTRNATGALAGESDTASAFSGTTSGFARSDIAGNAPDTFSVEAWVRTTTNRGGKIIGFGNRTSGTSTLADRHLYMDNAGKIYFGMQSASLQTVNGPASYNNGTWHHVVGTYGSGAMNLYIDGALVGQRSDVSYERSYWGWWRIGGDRLTGWPSRPSSDYLAGTLDEVAVYDRVLSAEAVAAHHAVGTSGAPANRAPVASFTAAPSGLSVTVDGAASSDSDGTVVGYAWTFGDGAAAAGASASHTYAAPGTYTITLTVTDDLGATGSTTRQVEVTEPPAPGQVLAQDAFTRTVSTGWGTADVGGAWTSTGLASRFSVDGQQGRHTLVAGATNVSSVNAVSSTSTEVRVVVGADKVPTGSGAFVHVQGRRATATDYYGARIRLQADGSVQLHVTRGNGSTVAGVVVPGLTFAAGDRLQVRLQVDGVSPTTVRAKVWKVGSAEPASWQTSMTDSTASLQVPGSVGLGTYLFGSVTNGPIVFGFDDLWAGPVTENQAPTAAFTASPTGLSLSVDGSGSSDPDGSVAGYAWDFGDGATGTGAAATHTYAAAGTYTVTLTVTDNLGAAGVASQQVAMTAPPVGQAPVAAFTAAPAGLSVSVDGSGSSDPDGTITGYAWDFGDGATAAGVTASHTYAAEGSYTVTLTVVDNSGATGSTTKQVAVSAPPPAGALAQDAFARTVANGWGSADVGGAWASTGTASRFSVDGARALHTLAAGATNVSALAGVASTSTDIRVVISPDKVPNGGGSFVHVQGRRVTATDYYGARVRLQADGSVQLHVTRGNGTAVAGVVVPGLTYAAGDRLEVRLQVEGTFPTAVRAKVWTAGTAEPAAWQTTMTDSTASLQTAGSIGLGTYLFGTVTNGPVVLAFDDLSAIPLG